MNTEALLRFEDLSIGFAGKNGELKAVRNLSLPVRAGAITCLVGESGCGKSLTCRAVLRLTPEYANLSGKILFNGADILTASEKELRHVRGASIGMVFQEPMTSLNPVLTVGEQTAEPLRLHLGLSRAVAKQKVVELFTQVGIPSAQSRYNDYPHKLSGGMRQRVMIAMALACGPELLLADEPVTALDTTIQGQILRLLQTESRDRNMAVLLITHDLGVVAEVGNYVGVMYAGILVEYAAAKDLFSNPLHPYTQGLIACAPDKSSLMLDRLPVIPGTVPGLAEMPSGCPFEPRCSRAMPKCKSEIPPGRGDNGHRVACWLYGYNLPQN